MKISREEFERLALKQIDAVDRAARTLTKHSVEADDLVQETYCRAIKAWESFELQSFGIRPWLLRILHNLYVTRSKREARQPRATDSDHLQAMPDPSNPPFTFSEAGEELNHALDQLPVELRTTITLWALDELKYHEIAQVMGIPIGTVMSRLHRARQQLRELLPGITPRRDVDGNSR
ncbi:MAG: sigma-70 family RNA polymerase sigma factor [Planctomycetota bacterium]|nr:sigma-70 family RNA polymerase sigma factor [Planctomycetota bacterium]